MTTFQLFALAALLGSKVTGHPQFFGPSCDKYDSFRTESTKDVSKFDFWGTSDDICRARKIAASSYFRISDIDKFTACELASTQVNGVSYSWSWTVGGGLDM